MVERVDFDSPVPAAPLHKRWKASSSSGQEQQSGKKRKRENDEALVAEGVLEDDESMLPAVWPSALKKSGSGAVVVFVDRKSARGAWKAVHSAVKEGRRIPWTAGEGLGVERKYPLYPKYAMHTLPHASYPSY